MNKIPSDELLHIGIVVRDARASARKFSQVYGISDWAITDHAPDRLTNTSTHGYKADQHFLTATGKVKTDSGTVTFRLIEPKGGWTTYQEFLMTHGEGIHHVCTGAVEKSQFAQLRDWLASENVTVAQTSCLDGTFNYICLDTRELLGGFYVQLLMTESDQREPSPDEVWHFDESITHAGGLLPLGTFQMHFGVVVYDLMKRVESWTRLFGVTKWSFMNWHTAPGSLEEPFYMGKPVNHAYFTTLVTLSPLLAFEIIQPTFGPSHYKENYRDVVGEGIHHINATMFPNKDQWLLAEERMAKFGSPVVMGGGLAGGFANFYYLDTHDALGYVTEVVHPGPNWDRGMGSIRVAMNIDTSVAYS